MTISQFSPDRCLRGAWQIHDQSPTVNLLEATSPIMSEVSLLDSEVAPDHWPDSDRRQSVSGSLAIGPWNHKGKSTSTYHWNFVVWIAQNLRQGHYILCT